jgi:hypothetical protein
MKNKKIDQCKIMQMCEKKLRETGHFTILDLSLVKLLLSPYCKFVRDSGLSRLKMGFTFWLESLSNKEKEGQTRASCL